jgi:hypothetical protein
MLTLLFHAFGQVHQIPHSAFDLALRTLKLGVGHQRRGARQAPAGAVGDREHHREISQQLLGNRRRLRFELALCF